MVIWGYIKGVRELTRESEMMLPHLACQSAQLQVPALMRLLLLLVAHQHRLCLCVPQHCPGGSHERSPGLPHPRLRHLAAWYCLCCTAPAHKEGQTIQELPFFRDIRKATAVRRHNAE